LKIGTKYVKFAGKSPSDEGQIEQNRAQKFNLAEKESK